MSKAWLEATFKDEVVLGLDEAGRGPLAGPCVVCGVILPSGFDHPLINDSKQLSSKQRQAALKIILKEALWIMFEAISPERIDQENIYRATQNAMRRIAGFAPCQVVFTDAMPLHLKDKQVYDFIKGDQRSISIAAASILAKEMRDAIMLSYDALYPAYGFKRHKGYPTKEHLRALHQHGVLTIHRKSFGPVAQCLKLSLFD